jgi:dipeptidyl aminopeptidase/acylaminoacyl peptidase
MIQQSPQGRFPMKMPLRFPADLVPGEVVRFKSFDGVEIPGLLYKPRGASATSKVPALVSVHGGPGGQSRVGYSGFTQFLVNHGYAVYSINNRGSSGYGKTFFMMDDRKHGEGDLDDCVPSKKMLTATGWVDGDRIEAVRKKGILVEYIVFPNEGHGFIRKESQEKAYQSTLELLDKYLKGAKAAAAR